MSSKCQIYDTLPHILPYLGKEKRPPKTLGSPVNAGGSVEAATGFEPVNNGFANHRLRPTWLHRLFKTATLYQI